MPGTVAREIDTSAERVELAMDEGLRASRRKLLLRDGLAFFVLTLVTVVLFVLTLLLFRSFTTHRADLAVRWAGRGKAALSAGRPAEAVGALRAALSYAPDDREYLMMLAEALEASGHTEEARSYFLNLWESQPGDGVINLELARLARKKSDREDAVRYYRAAVFGSWEGDGVTRRRNVRLELANYLIDEKEYGAAQTDLMIAASNAPADAGLAIGFGDALLRAGDSADALSSYGKAIRLDPRNALAYEKAGRLAYSMGRYGQAKEWLEKAVRESAGGLLNQPGTKSAAEPEDLEMLLKNAERLMVLSPAGAKGVNERGARVLADLAIAKTRFDACAAQLQREGPIPAGMQGLNARWLVAKGMSTRAEAEENQDVLMGLVGDSETATTQLCGAPTGDDALLVRLVQSGNAVGR